MILDRLFRPKPAQIAGASLYATCVEQARSPVLYAEFGAPDTVEGRFEIYTLHVVLLLDRLVRQGPKAAEVSQGLFDTYVRSLDDALREMGVGDLSVGKNYEAAFAALPQVGELDALLARTVYAGVEDPPVARLRDYVLAQRRALAGQGLEPILEGRVAWSPVG